MKAIRTKYSHYNGVKQNARYTASDGDGNQTIVTVSEIEQALGDGNWSPEGYHRYAAQKLCDKMGWVGEFVTGFFRQEAYHVFLTK
jgi:hypothetical protein